MPAEQLLDSAGQRLPLITGYFEVAPQVEQRALAYGSLNADRFHQPIGVIRFSGAPALDGGAADVHVRPR